MRGDLRLWHGQTKAERKATIKRRMRKAKAAQEKAQDEAARWRKAWLRELDRLAEMEDEA